MQHRLENVLRRFNLQIKQQHADMLKPPARTIVTHQFNNIAVAFVLPNLQEKRNDALFLSFEDLQNFMPIGEQNAGDVQTRIADLSPLNQRTQLSGITG